MNTKKLFVLATLAWFAPAIVLTVSAQNLTVTDGLRLWLKADTGVTTAPNGGVTQWADQSGSGNNAIQATETLAPVLVNNILNAKPVVRFDGVDDYLDVADSDTVSITGDLTSFFVVKFDDFATFRAVWAKTTSNLPAPNDTYALPGSGIFRVFRGDGTMNVLGNVDSMRALRAGTYQVVGFAAEAATLTHYLNGQANGSGAVPTALADADTPLKIGTRGDLFTKLKGDLAELVIYDRALSASERDSVNDYLKTKYNILNLPPTISLAANPPGPNINAGQTLTLTATASDPDGTINRVEFYANGSRIATAIAPPYVLRATLETAGPVEFTARVFDNEDATGDSLPLNFTVAGSGPPSLTVTNGLQLWLKADAGVTMGPSGGVIQWDDQSGHANTAVQADENSAPTVVANALNGQPVLHFDGIDDYLDVADSDSLSIAGDITSFFVVRFEDFATFRAVWGKTQGNLPAPTDFYTLPNSGLPRVYRGNGTGASLGNVDGAQPFPAAAFAFGGFEMAGTTLTHYLNGQANGSGAIAATLADTDQPLKIGTRNDLFTRFQGDMAELLIYDVALSSADRRALELYLANKYSFTLVTLVNDAPTATITKPTGGASFVAPAVVEVTATAADGDGAVAKVDFLVNGTVVATDTTAPYGAMLNFPAADTPVLTVVVTDNLGATRTSDPVAISITTTAQIPLPLPANLKLWLRADAGVTTNGDGLVTAWEDQSGNLNHATQSDQAAAPQLLTDALNGLPALRFDGVDDFMTVAHSPSVAIAGDISSFFVVRFDDFATFRAVWAKTVNNVPRATDWYALPGSGVPRLYRGGSGEASVDGMALPAAEFLIAGFDMTGITAHHYFNGLETGAGQINRTFADGGRPLFIGTRDDRVTRMQGEIVEIILYNAALSNRNRNAVFRYLTDKYGIPVTLRPDLAIRRSGASVVLSWPTSAAGYVLETAPTVPDGIWDPETTAIVVVGDENTVTLAAPDATRFFRLRQP